MNHFITGVGLAIIFLWMGMTLAGILDCWKDTLNLEPKNKK